MLNYGSCIFVREEFEKICDNLISISCVNIIYIKYYLLITKRLVLHCFRIIRPME